ncbi:hypothetical protein Gogos_009217 [Gossypium gossypioides]|uniref:BZIP domain-containing protein n=1 Tax=Gossypium gossypioides TaxID=34282 RepID=A0A7J9CEI9_GOSGO|nr:hypothetical protein [Gossypium gossypioides]
MEGYSSDGSTSFSSSRMADGWDLISTEFGLVEGSDINGGVTDSVTDHHQLNQGETSKASYQTAAGGGLGGRAKLTPAQRKENKRLSDHKYRQKRKITADEQASEIKHLKEENEQLNAENRRITMDLDLKLQSGYGNCSRSLSLLFGSLQMNEIKNLQQMNSEAGTCSNDDTSISDLLMKIDADEESKVKFTDFTGLDGEHVTVGKYCFPLSLLPTLKLIINVYGDVAATSKMSPSITERIYVMFCASIKEMHDLRLEQITECRILKWRDAIKDALRMNFKVDFAMEHLKKIACAYIGLMERQRMEEVALRISKLEAELSASKKEHSKICERFKVYMDTTKEFIGKPVSLGMLKAQNRRLEDRNRRRQIEQSINEYKRESAQPQSNPLTNQYQIDFPLNPDKDYGALEFVLGDRHVKGRENGIAKVLIIMNRKDLRGCPRSFTICLPSCSVCMIDELTYGISCNCLPLSFVQHIMIAIQVTTQHSLSIETENTVLRAELSELSARLESLNETESISLMTESNDGEGGRIQS